MPKSCHQRQSFDIMSWTIVILFVMRHVPSIDCLWYTWKCSLSSHTRTIFPLTRASNRNQDYCYSDGYIFPSIQISSDAEEFIAIIMSIITIRLLMVRHTFFGRMLFTFIIATMLYLRTDCFSLFGLENICMEIYCSIFREWPKHLHRTLTIYKNTCSLRMPYRLRVSRCM